MGKFGIAVISTMDREIQNYMEHTTHPTMFKLIPDVNRRGVAPTRNRAIKALYDAGCEYIVLFDDDCYPIRDGWQDLLLRAHKASGSQLLVYPKDSYSSHATRDEVELVAWGIGAFTFMTREMVEAIGYFNTAYDTYGHEDVAYLARARATGLTMSHSFDTAPIGITKFIYSVDCDKNAVSVPTLPQVEKNRLIEKNREIFNREISDGILYYPYVGGSD